MKKIFFTLTTLCVLPLFLAVTNSYAKEVGYDRAKAKTYAERHCGSGKPPDVGYNTEKYKCFNPNNPNCESSGTDCANFMSQALIDGGITFSDCINSGYSVKGEDAKCDKKQLIKGRYIIGKDGKTAGVPAASDLGIVLQLGMGSDLKIDI
ncbi:MAG: hypothetical protein FJ130_10915 [Deltaproteobacteria bacterium]|nr:hypothetical protein [Deltaproteobacteria bacterium]